MSEEIDKDAENDQDLLDLLNEVDKDSELEEEESEVDEPEVKSKEVNLPSPVSPPEAQQSDVQTALTDLAHIFSGTAHDILNNSQSDRAQLEEAISHLGDLVMGGGNVPSVVVEQWVTAMSKKADINISMTKLTDSIAKLLSAAKNHHILTDGINGDDDIDFDELLGDG